MDNISGASQNIPPGQRKVSCYTAAISPAALDTRDVSTSLWLAGDKARKQRLSRKNFQNINASPTSLCAVIRYTHRACFVRQKFHHDRPHTPHQHSLLLCQAIIMTPPSSHSSCVFSKACPHQSCHGGGNNAVSTTGALAWREEKGRPKSVAAFSLGLDSTTGTQS